MKTSKKYLSLFLAVILMLSSLPLPVMADPSKTSLTPTGDVYIGYASSAPVKNEYEFVRLYKASSTPEGWSKGSVGAFSYDISSVWNTLAENDGYVIKSATWKAYSKYTGTTAPSVNFNFYMMDTSWTESTISKDTLPANVSSYPVWNTSPDVTQNSEITTSEQLQSYDITALLRKHMNENESEANKNFFSFAIELDITSGKAECDITANSSTATNANAAVLEVEYFKPTPIAIDGEPTFPENPNDDFEIRFNNPINEASVKIGGATITEGVTINDTKIIVDYSFAQCKPYIIDVFAKDAYGYSVSETYAFATGFDTDDTKVEMNSGRGDGTFLSADDSESARPAYGGYNVWYNYPENGSDSFLLYKVALTHISADKYLDKAVFNFNSVNQVDLTSWRVFEFAGDDWDIANIKYADSAVYEIITDYQAHSAGVPFAVTEDSGYYRTSVDITDYVSECILAGQEYIFIGVTAERATAKLHTHYGFKPYITYHIANNPSPSLVSDSASFSGTTLNSLSFKTMSLFDKAIIEGALSLQTSSGSVIDDAEFVCDSGRVYLKAPVALEAETTYKVVAAIGTADKFGNQITADNSVVYEFTTDFDDDSSPANPKANALKVNYNSDTSSITVFYLSEYYRNHDVTVSIINTDDGSTFYTDDLKTDSSGILKLADISVTSDGNYIVYAAPAYGHKAHADVVNEAYADFLWELAAHSTDAYALEERFDAICETFGLSVGCSDKIDDMGAFYDKLTSLRGDYLIGAQNAENIALLKTAFEEIGLFTATEDINDLTAPSDARELYDAMLAKIADRNFASKLAQVEAQCSSDGSPFFADVYNGFISSSKTINSYADFENMLKASYNTEKAAVILGKFAAMTHLSQVGALLTDAETVDAFGIQTYVNRYNALNSTSVVDNALYGKTFANTSAFISALSSALTSAERVDPPAPQKPTSSPIKGGSAIVGAIGAPVDTTPVVNNEKLLYTDLAGYDWAKEYIDALSADGIINGKGNGEFDPAGKVLREEAVKMIVEAFGITASGNAAFDDVNSDDWFRDFVLTAKNAGIVNGVSDTSFGAGLSITRQDAAVMLFTALSKKGLASAIAGSDSTFADDADIATYALDAVRYMNSVGAITGYSDGTFKPMSTITRAEFAVVLGRIYNTLK